MKKRSTKAKGKGFKNEASQHKQQLEALKEKDPEFFEYLQKNDKELLEFNLSDESDSNDEEAQALEEAGLKDQEKVAGPSVVTNELVSSWQHAITKKKSLRILKRLLLAFRAAAHVNDADDISKTFAYKITSAAVFNNLVVVCLKHVSDVFDHHLKTKDVVTKKNLPNTAKKWKTVEPLVRSYITSLLHLLRSLSENDMVYFVLKETEKSIPYFLCFTKQSKNYLKELLQFWGTGDDKVKIASFLNVRTLVTTAPKPFVETCLKGIYMTFVRSCQTTTTHTLPGINLMRNCGVQVFGIDLNTSYQTAFVYIRQLAIHLRNSMAIKSQESYKSVYNWQFIHCIEFWSQLLATHCDKQRVAESGESVLQPLIYPLVQVTIGVISRTGVFIPLAPYIFSILSSPEIRRKPKPSTLKPLDFSVHLKAPKSYLHTRVYQDGLIEELVRVMGEYYGGQCLSIAFPELAIPAIVQIKRHVKKSKNLKLNKQLHVLVEKFEQNAKYIQQKRQHVEFSPNNRAQVKTFLKDSSPEETPLGAYIQSVRKLKEQRKQLTEQS
ncbi:10089_t:CDS:10 [Paraglomus occultum]|uniref:10089_t:CDS:1 n=1 Tax=Paraglomus occultum TaxID=144539 RepID=A0A9N8YTR7_9GLOM|nr:10089_t:CDS:10 [Paraglomus occultum]